ncbi:hypothetical protein HK102_012418, partial [Quaeritorhiza haematococci]
NLNQILKPPHSPSSPLTSLLLSHSSLVQASSHFKVKDVDFNGHISSSNMTPPPKKESVLSKEAKWAAEKQKQQQQREQYKGKEKPCGCRFSPVQVHFRASTQKCEYHK